MTQCEHTDPPVGRRRYGRRCRRSASWHVFSKATEGGADMCDRHGRAAMAGGGIGGRKLQKEKKR